jgi:large subunit ribosomal protein L3
MSAILAKKLGMTQVFLQDGSVARVTVLQAGPCPVTAIRTRERDGYDAVQLAFGQSKEKHISKPELGHLRKADAPPMRHLAEFRDTQTGTPQGGAQAGEAGRGSKIPQQLGETVTVESFEVGARVKVSGTSKGKGFQGTIKRHNFASGPKAHGSHNVRAPGSIGASATPSRVLKGIRGPGQMGNRRVTQKGLEVVAVDAKENLLLVRGSVPGPRGGVVEVRTDA